jgi:hypothetical protein
VQLYENLLRMADEYVKSQVVYWWRTSMMATGTLMMAL